MYRDKDWAGRYCGDESDQALQTLENAAHCQCKEKKPESDEEHDSFAQVTIIDVAKPGQDDRQQKGNDWDPALGPLHVPLLMHRRYPVIRFIFS